MPSSAPAPCALSALSLHDALPISRFRGVDDLLIALWIVFSTGFAVAPAALIELRAAKREPSTKRDLAAAALAFAVGIPLRARLALRSEEHTSELQSPSNIVCRPLLPRRARSPLFPYTTLFRSPAFAAWTICSSPSGSSSRQGSPWLRPRSSSSAPRSASRARSVISPPPRSPSPSGSRFVLGSRLDRKSTRLNSSHRQISYAVLCSRAVRALRSFPTRRSSDLPLSRRGRSAHRPLDRLLDRVRRGSGRAHRAPRREARAEHEA